MTARRRPAHYYYAGGKRVALDPESELVAVDESRLAEVEPNSGEMKRAVQSTEALSGRIRLVPRRELNPDLSARLEENGATQPVFRQGDTTLIALPEVRVEDDRASVRDKIRKFAAEQVIPSDVTESEGRLTLHPRSNSGRDALDLANEIVERFHPTSVSPRFLRITAGPPVRP
jgi:hypothetical protein